MRVALLSGGKESFYAAYLYGGIDLGLILIYEFPRPSPHLINIHKSIETLTKSLTNSVAVVKLRKGFEREETVDFLRRVKAEAIIAGDVYVEDHLKYMESIARDVGADLVEPLWGMDPYELLFKEFRDLGMSALIIGADERIKGWLGKELGLSILEGFAEEAKEVGIDPLGEQGEYHTLVTSSSIHKEKVKYEIASREEYGGYGILRLL